MAAGAEGFSQDTRLLRLATALGTDDFTAISLRGAETVSSLFSFSAEAFGPASINPNDILGHPAVVTLTRALGDDHHFHGIVQALERIGYDATGQTGSYVLTLVPDVWRLTQTFDCRIFQDKTTIQIATEIFSEWGIVNFRFDVIGDSRSRAYCVQYRESSFDFLTRLFEEDGLFYYFEHSADRHVLVIADMSTTCRPATAEAVSYRLPGMEARSDTATRWRDAATLLPGRFALHDFNYDTPSADLGTQLPVLAPPAPVAAVEVFDYPGRYDDHAAGEHQTRLRAETLEAHRRLASAESNAPALRAGLTFTLRNHDIPDVNRPYLLLSVSHGASNDLAGHSAGYANRFTCLDASIPYRPRRVTRQPRIEGAQTAMVVGPPGAEIHTDRLGRVKLRFHWDRRAKSDDTSSCWVRVSQGMAGRLTGSQWVPRVGMEVVVDFLEGDPDRPLVTGVVYNGDNMPPFDLPGRATVSGTRTLSTPGGGGFNELSFDDSKGAEQVFLRAETRLDVNVGGDRRESVQGSRHLTVGRDRRTHITGDDDVLVEGDRRSSVTGQVSLCVSDGRQEQIAADDLKLVGGDVVILAGSAIVLRVGGSVVRIDDTGIDLIGPQIRLNSGGGGGGRSAMPDLARRAEPALTGNGGATPGPPAPRSLARAAATQTVTAQGRAFRDAAAQGAPFCAQCAAAEGGIA